MTAEPLVMQATSETVHFESDEHYAAALGEIIAASNYNGIDYRATSVPFSEFRTQSPNSAYNYLNHGYRDALALIPFLDWNIDVEVAEALSDAATELEDQGYPEAAYVVRQLADLAAPSDADTAAVEQHISSVVSGDPEIFA